MQIVCSLAAKVEKERLLFATFLLLNESDGADDKFSCFGNSLNSMISSEIRKSST